MQTTQQRAYVYHTQKKHACQRKKQREKKNVATGSARKLGI